MTTKALVRVHAIAANTFREAIRNKLLFTLLGFSIALIGAGVLLASLSYVEVDEILQDVGMSAIRLFSAGIAIFVGVGLIHDEVDRRTIFTILSKPVSRAEFLVGKWAGLTFTVWLQLVLMAACFALVSTLADAPIGVPHALAIILLALELAVLVAVATLFSSFTTPMLASFYTFGLWLIGHLSRDLYLLGQRSEHASIPGITAALYRVLPDFEVFNKTLEAVHGIPIRAHEVGFASLYAVSYTVVILMIASAVFARRDLK